MAFFTDSVKKYHVYLLRENNTIETYLIKWNILSLNSNNEFLARFGLNKSVNSFQLIKLRKNKPEGPSREFYRILGVYFNAVRAVFLEIFRYIQTDRQTYMHMHTESFIL